MRSLVSPFMKRRQEQQPVLLVREVILDSIFQNTVDILGERFLVDEALSQLFH